MSTVRKIKLKKYVYETLAMASVLVNGRLGGSKERGTRRTKH